MTVIEHQLQKPEAAKQQHERHVYDYKANRGPNHMHVFWFLLVIILAAQPAFAKDIVINMKNSGAGGMMVFEPSYVQANVGDTVHFVPTDFGHNAEPIPGMVPDGISEEGGAMNKEYSLTLAKPGLYGIRCRPHFMLGMIALIKAGKGSAANETRAAKVKLPMLAEKRMALLWAQAK